MTERTQPGMTRDRSTGRGNRRIWCGRFGRYLAPLDDGPVLQFFLDHLYVAHNRSERLCRALLSPAAPGLTSRLAAAETVGVEVDGYGVPTGGEASGEAAAGLRAVTGPLAARIASRGGVELASPVRWIFRCNDAPRGGGVLFLFGIPNDRPALVVKVGRAGRGLRREREALERCRRRLPDPLRATLPQPLAFGREGDREVLVLPWRRGRSAYDDLYRDLSSDWRSALHFDAAARWLADFQRATGRPADDRVPGHGDFWPGNLLLAEVELDPGDAPGPAGPLTRAAGEHALRSETTVIDWEDFTPLVQPVDDLFRFPFSYALHHPWEGYRRAAPEEAFARAFLRDTELSRHVRRYLEIYCERVGPDPPALRRPFAEWLARRQRQSASASARPYEKGVPWHRLASMLAQADRSVFSG